MPTPATLADLYDLLDGGATLLLPNARAAGELRAGFDRRQQALGLVAWQPPSVLAWDQWTGGLWSELVSAGEEPRLLLNAAQEHALWRETVAADPAASTLAGLDSLADLARSAWRLAASSNATQRLRSAAATHDSRTFAEWSAAFTRLCAGRGYLSASLLEDALGQHLAARKIAAPRTLHLAGFDEFTAAQEALLAALRARGTEIVQLSLQATATTFRASSIVASEREELLLAARWIREFLERDAADGRRASVAVLVPNIAQDRDELEAVFREVLAPELQAIGSDLSSAPWEMAGGVPLHSLGLISTALDLAHWAAAPLSIERVSSLLLSPYLGQPAEREIAAEFDARVLRRVPLLRPEISLASLVALLDRPKSRALLSPPPHTPGQQVALLWPARLHSFLQRSLQHSGDLSRPRTFAEWTEFLRQLLRAAGWAASGGNASESGDDEHGTETGATGRVLTASEVAAVEAWDSVLDLVATLDFSGRRVPFSTALEALEQQARTSLFAPPSSHAPVQVMTPADSRGSVFDATVFLRATDTSWPPPQRVNPLLPWALQRSLHLPGTDARMDAERARTLTANLLARSGSVLFTSAAENADGRLRPSPLLSELGTPQIATAELVATAAAAAPVAMEFALDEEPLPAPPSAAVYGGARVLQLQAACGFLAFAELRLRASQPERAELGLNARESGTLLHKVLQLFWRRVRSQEELRRMTAPERSAMLRHCLEEVRPIALAAAPWDVAYLTVQRDRQLSLLEAWLEHELRRGPFTVLAVEEEQHIPIGPLTLAVRMDRVDQVEDGVVFVDYKTGAVANPSQWEGPRPDEPQLPLYALFPEPGQLKGIAFARVRAGSDMGWKGYQDEPGILPSSTAKNTLDLAGEVAEWHTILTQLAEDFAGGRAEVDPKKYPETCSHCGQRLLCRLNPASVNSAALNSAAEDDSAGDGSMASEGSEAIDG